MWTEFLDVPHPRDQFGAGVGLDQTDPLPAPDGRERPPTSGGLAVPETPSGEPERVIFLRLVGEGNGGCFHKGRAHAVTPFWCASRRTGQGRTPGDSRPYDGCPYGARPYGGVAIAAGRAWRPLPTEEPAEGRLAGRAVMAGDVVGAMGTAEGSRPQSPRRRRAAIRVRT